MISYYLFRLVYQSLAIDSWLNGSHRDEKSQKLERTNIKKHKAKHCKKFGNSSEACQC